MARTYEQCIAAQAGAQVMAFAQLQSQAERLEEELARVQNELKTKYPKVFRKLYPKPKGPSKDGLPIVDMKQ